MNQNRSRLHGQSGGGAHARAPDWLASLTAMLLAGKHPANGWVVLSLVGDLAPWVPCVDANSYRRGDDLSILHGLDVEIVVDDETPYGLLRDLTNSVLAAGPRLLGVSIGGVCPTVAILKKTEVSHHGTQY